MAIINKLATDSKTAAISSFIVDRIVKHIRLTVNKPKEATTNSGRSTSLVNILTNDVVPNIITKT